MSRIPVRISLAAAAIAAGWLCLGASTAPSWKIQFFYDKDDAELQFRDLQCPSKDHCVAAGIVLSKGRAKGTQVLTHDGGKNWTETELKERPQTLFFLNDANGWMATEGGIWRTGDGGQSWEKLQKLSGIQALYFLTADHGFAAGYPKAAYETTDGGRNWTKIAAAETPKADSKQTVYGDIAFANSQEGFILGSSINQFKARNPSWLDPEKAQIAANQGVTILMLSTVNGGEKWNVTEQHTLSGLTRIATNAAGGPALGLFQNSDFANYPTEVFRMDLKTYHKELAFKAEDRNVTDMLLLPRENAFLAAIEAPGKLKDSPIPGKLHILGSNDLTAWKEMDVDYRAVGREAMLAGVDPDHAWVATDTGMILRLMNSPQ